jgi:hypothetical protein
MQKKWIIDGVNDRVSQTRCPFCEADDWTGGQLVGFPTIPIEQLPADPERKTKTLATVIWLCGHCGFIRAHSVAPELAFR